jgi:hypothetical protein
MICFPYSSDIGQISFSYLSDIGRQGPGRGVLTRIIYITDSLKLTFELTYFQWPKHLSLITTITTIIKLKNITNRKKEIYGRIILF